MQDTVLKVGVVSRRAGVTVRTLRYYDEIGLLSPSGRTEGQHRVYTGRDLLRLQQIKALQRLGFSLDEVRDCLERPEYSPLRTVELQLDRLRLEIQQRQQLCLKLQSLASRLRDAQEASVDELFETLEGMTMFEKHYTPQQLQQLEERARQLGPERIREVEAEWPRLMAEVRAAMENGTDPADPLAQELGRRWMGLVREFTGGDHGISASLGKMYQQEPAVQQRSGLDPSLFEYVGKIQAAARGQS